jgi:hypothetical protein
MVEPHKILLSPRCTLTTETFLCLLAAWATLDPCIKDRFQVVTLTHNKRLESPEHEFLIIETSDRNDGSRRLFILERTLPAPGDPVELADGPDLRTRAAKIASSGFKVLTAGQSADLASMEEGSYSLPDEASLISMQSSDLLSDVSCGSNSGKLPDLKAVLQPHI